MEEYVLGVVGAGMMGAGVAQCAAQHQLNVLLVDTSAEALEKARGRLGDDLRLAQMLTGVPAADALSRITFTTSLDGMAKADFVVESISENVAAKEKLYGALDAVCRPEVCFASNTSAIPISRMAARTRREPWVLGIHFMNPVPLRPVVELIRAAKTSDAAMAAARGLLQRMGKKSVEVRDGPGFVGNRVLMLAVNEAIALVAEGRAPPANIDRVFTGCMGHKMGPLATADLIGLDVIRDTLVVLAEHSDPKYAPHPLLEEMVRGGKLGRKSGAGFFNYPSPSTNP